MAASRPRDAATIILLRRRASTTQVLMGRRPRRDQWSRAYVFPGGRVDPTDHRAASATRLQPQVAARLSRAASAARARSLAIAAIRELYEETGLFLAKPGEVMKRPAGTWREFADAGLAPDLSALRLLSRAVTPPYRPKRFNARFFVAPFEAVRGELSGGSAELADLRWLTVPEARELNLPRITERVLTDLEDWLGRDDGRRQQASIPVYRMLHGEHRLFRE